MYLSIPTPLEAKRQIPLDDRSFGEYLYNRFIDNGGNNTVSESEMQFCEDLAEIFEVAVYLQYKNHSIAQMEYLNPLKMSIGQKAVLINSLACFICDELQDAFDYSFDEAHQAKLKAAAPYLSQEFWDKLDFLTKAARRVLEPVF